MPNTPEPDTPEYDTPEPDTPQSSTPEPPYYAVIFPNRRTDADDEGYAAMAQRMVELAQTQPGYLGMDSVRNAQGFAITVSYWQSLDAIKAWRDHPEHLEAQAKGREKWYAAFDLHIARVEKSYSFKAD
jgi:heme-degrading monooxygenase HmoA